MIGNIRIIQNGNSKELAQVDLTKRIFDNDWLTKAIPMIVSK